ncbi:hypothetical protein J1N35_029893 [Gossypium stocksii]|uniref:Uncharacterized protein n=1 Tax=Gossypium stocksii TaxID=47602 RepID=A0A9D3UYT1_9ROSI|nr:hypothetical protein J1N35_029893 [Gossypium stocksii]
METIIKVSYSWARRLETVVAIQEDTVECHKSTLIKRIQQLLTKVYYYHIRTRSQML